MISTGTANRARLRRGPVAMAWASSTPTPPTPWSSALSSTWWSAARWVASVWSILTITTFHWSEDRARAPYIQHQLSQGLGHICRWGELKDYPWYLKWGKTTDFHSRRTAGCSGCVRMARPTGLCRCWLAAINMSETLLLSHVPGDIYNIIHTTPTCPGCRRCLCCLDPVFTHYQLILPIFQIWVSTRTGLWPTEQRM